MVMENLRVAQSRQKSYTDHRRREMRFDVGDFVYLMVSAMRGLRRLLEKKGLIYTIRLRVEEGASGGGSHPPSPLAESDQG
jgi:hypothetical protein